LNESIQFDMVVSVSSLEHSGLGRYGDELNPRGDIDAAEEVYCMLKPGGYFLISMPYVRRSNLVWNAHREYGPERMKLFAAGYRQVDFFGELWDGNQSTFVLQRPCELETSGRA
jgi:predicted SAM-dependent methyltransferase